MTGFPPYVKCFAGCSTAPSCKGGIRHINSAATANRLVGPSQRFWAPERGCQQRGAQHPPNGRFDPSGGEGTTLSGVPTRRPRDGAQRPPLAPTDEGRPIRNARSRASPADPLGCHLPSVSAGQSKASDAAASCGTKASEPLEGSFQSQPPLIRSRSSPPGTCSQKWTGLFGFAMFISPSLVSLSESRAWRAAWVRHTSTVSTADPACKPKHQLSNTQHNERRAASYESFKPMSPIHFPLRHSQSPRSDCARNRAPISRPTLAARPSRSNPQRRDSEPKPRPST